MDILHENGIDAETEGDYLLLPMMNDAYVAAICKQLVSSNLSVYRIEKREKSLEDIFLSLTGKEVSL
jgi:ABC-2 type transport system ATP-binding protein